MGYSNAKGNNTMNKFNNALAYYIAIPSIYFFQSFRGKFFSFFRISFSCFYIMVIGYRRKVVQMNLARSFPEKSEKELKTIEVRFYRYFADMILEMLKLVTMSPSQKLERCKMDEETQSLFNELHSKGRSTIIVIGHYGNWEYCPAGLPLQTDFQTYVIYHPLSNPYFDRLMSRMRTRTSCKLYTMAGTLKGMISNRHGLNMTTFLSDQSPDPKGGLLDNVPKPGYCLFQWLRKNCTKASDGRTIWQSPKGKTRNIYISCPNDQ